MTGDFEGLSSPELTGLHCSGFLLALAYWQLGDERRARKHYGWSVKWMAENAPEDIVLVARLRRLRDEAADLLGVGRDENGGEL